MLRQHNSHKKLKIMTKFKWSQKYYKNLNKKQHLINNIWFNNILKQLKKDGFLYVPNINKSFNKNGQEIK
tara:strand:- start:1340 stop:1549 length:210 start_codon:yes stop_codon:yes gene_type:complete